MASELPCKRAKIRDAGPDYSLVLFLVADWISAASRPNHAHVFLLRRLLCVSRRVHAHVLPLERRLFHKCVEMFPVAENGALQEILEWYFEARPGQIGGFCLYVTPEYGPSVLPVAETISKKTRIDQNVGPVVAGVAFSMGRLGSRWYAESSKPVREKRYMYRWGPHCRFFTRAHDTAATGAAPFLPSRRFFLSISLTSWRCRPTMPSASPNQF